MFRAIGSLAGAHATSAESSAGFLCIAIGLFGAAALVSVVGSIVTYYGRNILFQLAAGLALVTGFLAVLGLASGCVLMGRETRLAVRNLEANIRIKRR